MDKELKEYIEQSEYYNDIDWDRISDKQKERIKDTLHYHFWELRKALGELGLAILEAKWLLLVFAVLSYLIIKVLVDIVF